MASSFEKSVKGATKIKVSHRSNFALADKYWSTMLTGFRCRPHRPKPSTSSTF